MSDDKDLFQVPADGLDRRGQVVWTFPVARAEALIDSERAETRACAVSQFGRGNVDGKIDPKAFPPE